MSHSVIRNPAVLVLLAACAASAPGCMNAGTPKTSTGTNTATRTSFYLPMRDGTKIALDLSLPGGFAGTEKLPALLHQTRYYRSFDLGWKLRFATRRWPNQRKLFLSHGYAWVDVDVRGTGASFGRWSAPWSLDEIRDGNEIVDWIVHQPWSNGKVGGIGASYDGGSAELLLVNQNPAVRAVVPEFTPFDAYADLTFPGGIWLQSFSTAWQGVNRALDIGYLKGVTDLMPRVLRSSYHGVHPVDADADRSQLSQAMHGHEYNLDVAAMAQAITYRDDAPWPPGVSLDVVSPFAHIEEIGKSGAAVLLVEGWFDAGFPQAAINAYLTLNNPVRVVIGPWGHGEWANLRSLRHSRESAFNLDDELLRFFDDHLKGAGADPANSKSVAYFTFGENRWTSTKRWPPPETRTVAFYFDQSRTLSRERPKAEASDHYTVDLTVGTGLSSRWDLGGEVFYPDRRCFDKKLLHYTSPPLEQSLKVTGQPVVSLFLSSTASDGEFFAYLEDVDPGGRSSYVTEGELRGLHRALQPDPPTYNSQRPAHSFRRRDSRPLVSGEVANLSFAMIPTSHLFKKGHSIRVALAGADRDHFALLPGPAPTWQVRRDSRHSSSIELPVVPAQAPGDH